MVQKSLQVTSLEKFTFDFEIVQMVKSIELNNKPNRY